MNLQTRQLSPTKFWLCMTAYILISYLAFWFSSGGYSAILILFLVTHCYLVIWIVLTIVCVKAQQIKYSSRLMYLVLGIQTFAILLSPEDAGYYGITACSKNFIQRFLQPEICNGSWLTWDTFQFILGLYGLLITIFLIDVLRLQYQSTAR